MKIMSDAAQTDGLPPHGVSQLPADLTDEQLSNAPVMTSVDVLLIDDLDEDEDEAFAAALDS